MPQYYAIPTATLEDLLSKWLLAEEAITTGQNYSVEGLSVSRADLDSVVARINSIQRELQNRNTVSRGGQAGVMKPVWT